MRKYEKLDSKQKLDFMFDLINAFSAVKTPIDTANFIQDILTANEIRNLSIRLRIAKLLLSGKTYKEIGDETKVSSATIMKVNAWISRGGTGFEKVISNLPLKYDYPEKLSKGPIEYHLPEAIVKMVQNKVAVDQENFVKSVGKNIDLKNRYDKQFKSLHHFKAVK